MRVGLTGGVGSGKSTASARLAAHGALVIDADAIAREVVEPGTPGLGAVVARFGPDVLSTDGSLDRPALAALIFADEDARHALNRIVHPLVQARTDQLMAEASSDAIVVYDIPLLAESGRRPDFDLTVVVEAPTDVRVGRLLGRGMAETDARARMAAQASDEQRRAIADVVIDNGGSLEELNAAVDALWLRLAADPGSVEAAAPIK